MKYLVHLRLPEEFVKLAEAYVREIDGLVQNHPSNDHHCTLMTLRMDPSNERKALGLLEKIIIEPFNARVSSFDIFDDNSLVLRLTDSPGLNLLHLQVIRALGNLVDWNGTAPLNNKYKGDENKKIVHAKYGSPYCAQFYNPHITICELKNGNIEVVPQTETSKKLRYYDWPVKEFWLSKKGETTWTTIKKFENCEENRKEF